MLSIELSPSVLNHNKLQINHTISRGGGGGHYTPFSYIFIFCKVLHHHTAILYLIVNIFM